MEEDKDFEKVEFFAIKNFDNKYSILTVPISEGSRESRNPNMIPKELRLDSNTKEINEKLGIKDGMLFCHTGGFLHLVKMKKRLENF